MRFVGNNNAQFILHPVKVTKFELKNEQAQSSIEKPSKNIAGF